jgi:phosphate:Na+ symporter
MTIVASLLMLASGLGVFLAAISFLSKSLKKSAGAFFARFFKRVGNNRLIGYSLGVGSTAFLQSSSAVSVMTITFLRAGILNLFQAGGIMLGAKVGTTVTALLLAFGSISTGIINIGNIFGFFAAVGAVVLMISSKEKTQDIALSVTCFGMLFIGLDLMGDAFSFGKTGEMVLSLFDTGAMQSPLLLVLIGFLLTLLIQSSSAASGIIISMLSAGAVGSLFQAFFMMIGANIGTCVTAFLASIGKDADSKRVAFLHFFTSVLGGFFAFLVLLSFKAHISMLGLAGTLTAAGGLAIFNFAYNAVFTLLLLPFLSPLVAFCKRVIKDIGEKSQNHSVKKKKSKTCSKQKTFFSKDGNTANTDSQQKIHVNQQKTRVSKDEYGRNFE